MTNGTTLNTSLNTHSSSPPSSNLDFKNVASNYFSAALSPTAAAAAYHHYPAAFRSYQNAYGYHPSAAAAASTMDYTTLQYAGGAAAPYCIGTIGSDPWKFSMNNN